MAAMFFAIAVGIPVLYFCLVPAHAAGEAKFIFFDNGLAGYDKVEYSTNGGTSYTEMQLLSEKYSSGLDNTALEALGLTEAEHINPAYTYVTDVEIEPGEEIIFKGTDSGTVYDTTSNYQPNSASREWGYDYEDFVWTSAPQKINADWDCYYAPALAMQYKYNGSKTVNGETVWNDFIKNVKWADYQPTDILEASKQKTVALNLADCLKQYNYLNNDFTKTISFTDSAADEFRVIGTEDAPITYEEETNIYTPAAGSPEVTLTMKLKTAGAGSSTENAIQIIPKTAGKLRVYASSAVGTEVENKLQVLSGTGEQPLSEDIEVYDFSVIADTEYYLAGTQSVYIYDIEILDEDESSVVKLSDCIQTGTGVGTLSEPVSYKDSDTGTEYVIEKDAQVRIQSSGITLETAEITITPSALGELSVTGSVSSLSDDQENELTAGTEGTYTVHTGLSYKLQGSEISKIQIIYPMITDKMDTSNLRDKEKEVILEAGEHLDKNKKFTIIAGTEAENSDVRIDSNGYINLRGSSKNYPGLERSIRFTAGGSGYVTIMVRKGNSGRNLRLFKIVDGEKETVSSTSGGTATVTTYTLYFDTSGVYYIDCQGGGITVSDIQVTSYGYAVTSGFVAPEDGTNRTFTGYTYTMEGKCGKVNDCNTVGNDSQAAGAEGSYAETDGILNTFTGKTYRATATFYDYYSDWELTGTQLNERKGEYYTQNENDQTYRTSQTGHNNALVTYAEGSNTLSYAYQGDLWNQAIGDYYNDPNIDALYFGSNSWFTGEGRYNESDRYGTTIFDWRDGGYKQYITWEHDGDKKYWFYRRPEEREYLNNLKTGFDNPSHGFSNSRGVSGLLTEDSNNEQIKLKNSTKEVPYFNQDFLEGSNEKNAVYGKVYNDVIFDFKLNESTGYYEYDSTKAEYATRLTRNTRQKDSYYMQYTGNGVTKADQSSGTTYQFYPFNSTAANETFYNENLMFGMKLDIPIVTYKNAENRSGIFKFSGDDDVWIFIGEKAADGSVTNGALALDIGGTHGATGGVLDMKTGYAVVGSTYESGTGDISTDNEGNAMKEAATDIEKAAFAIATMDGVHATSDFIDVPAASFFDDKYAASGQYKAEVDEANNRYIVTLKGEITTADGKKTIVNSGEEKEVAFVLKNVKEAVGITSGAGDDAGTLALDLSIYYMERGLNSSNFKLAFSFAENTNREVEKLWTDHAFQQHEGGKVTVDLYQEMVTDASVGTPAEVTNDKMTVRSSVYNSGEKIDHTVSVEPDDPVSVDVDVGDDTKSLVLTLNGIKLTKTVYDIFKDDLSLQITNGADPIEPDENGYLSVQPGTRVTASFKAVTTTLAGSSDHKQESGDTTDRWTIVSTNGWLLESYPLNGTELAEDNLTAGNTTEVEDAAELSNGSDVRFIFIDNPSNAYNGATTEHLFTICTVNKADEVTISTDVSQSTSNPGIRPLFYLRDVWNGLLDMPEVLNTSSDADKYLVADNFGGTGHALTDYSVKESTDIDNYYISMVATGKKDQVPFNGTNNKVISPITFTDTPITLTTTVQKIYEDVALDNTNEWQHIWENLANSIPIAGHNYLLTYYISGEVVSDSTVQDGGYSTKYYYTDINGNRIAPVYPVTKTVTESGGGTENVSLYPFEYSGLTYRIQIVNTPLTELNLKKEWYPAIPPDGSATIAIYRGKQDTPGGSITTPELYKTLTFKGDGVYEGEEKVSGDLWSYKLSDLPLYDIDGKKYIYCGVETDYTPQDATTSYHVSYSPKHTVSIDPGGGGGPTSAYLFEDTDGDAFEDNSQTLTVTNRLHVDTEYILKVVKTEYDPTGTAVSAKPIKGATFALYQNIAVAGVDPEWEILEERISTDEEGEIQLTEPLEVGKTYKLVETHAALGYQRDGTEIIFTVRSDSGGLLYDEATDLTLQDAEGETLEKTDNRFYEGSSFDRTENLLTINLRNELYNIRMPSTGGGGIVYMIAGSLLMILLAMFLLALTGRKTRQEHL